MNRNGPVIIIEDDEDDRLLFKQVFDQLSYTNEVIFFADGQKALDFLNQSDLIPFLILSDINMPKLNGFALRDKIKMDAKLQVKCIPYLFFSTAVSQDAVIKAYGLSVQGFFLKPNSYEELVNTVSVIMEYWKRCASPSSYPHE